MSSAEFGGRHKATRGSRYFAATLGITVPPTLLVRRRGDRMKMLRPLSIIAAAALLLAPPSQAQTGKLYRVGFLSPRSFAPGTFPGKLTEEIARQLAQNGFTAGANLELVK